MNVRSLYFLICIISCRQLYSDSLWIPQHSPTSNWLFKCSFADSLNGWAAGDSGIIIHTSNGGLNWSKQNNTFNIFINDIFCLNARIGWAVAVGNFYGSVIIHTTNGGINW